MSENTFDPQVSNANLAAAQYYIDDDGSLKFVSPYLSSSNFDGTIPVVEETITAENILPGMLLQVQTGEYLPVVSVAYDDTDLEASPNTTITVNYIDNNNELNSIDYNFTDSVNVRYEDWANKHLGNQGWTITSGGNAIFANVGVRGDLEATTLDVGGDTGITYDGTSVVIGASVIINAPVTFNGSGSYVTFNDLSASYALQSYVDSINNRLSASYTDLILDVNTISASVDFLISASLVSEYDLITNGATKINGNNITTGTIDANIVNVSSGLTGNRGIKITSLGLTGYDGAGNQTFNINSNDGTVTIGAYLSNSQFNTASSTLNSSIITASSTLNSNITTASSILNSSITTASSNLSRDITTVDGRVTTASFAIGNRIVSGSAALDIVSRGTTITGNNIRTGTVLSGTYIDSSPYSFQGMRIILDGNGEIKTPNFLLDTAGNASFRGDITAKSGYFGNSSYGMSIIDDGSTVTIRSTTLRMGSQLSGTTLHGSINFYTTAGTSIGSISSAASNKTWAGLGDGIVLGTTADYFFIPSSGNTTTPRSRFRGSAIDFYNTSDLFRIRLNNSGLNIGSDAVINFFDTAENVGAYIDYAAASDTLLIDNGGAAGGVVNVRASDLQLNGVSVAGGGGGGGGVTSFKFGDTGLTETGAVAITGAEIITGINDNSIPNAKLINKGITIMSTTRNLGGSFIAGDIDGDVIASNTLPPVKISNATNLFSIGGTGVVRGVPISTITGPLTIGTLTVSTSLDYVFNLGTTAINLNRASGALGSTLGGVNISGSAAQLNNTTSLIGTTWGAQGGIIYNNNGILAGIATGTVGQFLRSNGTAAPSWQTIDSMVNPMTAVGDLIYGGTVDLAGKAAPTRLASVATGGILRSNGVGVAPSWFARSVTAGQVLTINSTGTDIEWASPPSGTLPSQTGNNGRFLTTNGSSTSWAFPVTSISVPAAFTSTFNSTTGVNTIDYSSTGGGAQNVLRSTGTGAVAMGKINAAHMNITSDNLTSRYFVRLNASDLSTLYYSTSNTYSSSKRFKKITSNSIVENSSWIDEINLVKFKYNSDINNFGENNARESIGLIAEDIAINPTLNQIVVYDDIGPEGIEYDKLSILLIPIIKELRDKVADLEARLDAAGL